MILTSRAITIDTSLKRIDIVDADDNRSVESIIAYNNGSVVAFIGGFDLTAAAGFPVPVGGYSPSFDIIGPLYARTASGTTDLRVLEIETGQV